MLLKENLKSKSGSAVTKMDAKRTAAGAGTSPAALLASGD
jgi:hypothetical protein